MALQTTLMRRSSSVAMLRPRATVTPLSLRLATPLTAGANGPLLDCTARLFSSGMDKQDGNHPQKELTTFQKLQKWMQPFVSGSKMLLAENKQAWAIRRRIKEAPPSSPPQLTRQEMMILRQAHRDLAKSLPLLIFFAVPLIGYAAPVIGYQFPKQLLPWQFWRPDQKTQFFREDAHARAKFYPELVKLLEQIDRKDQVLKELLAAHKDEKRGGLNPAQIGQIVPFFDPATDGPAALSKLKSHHIHVLVQSISLVPAFAWVWRLLPRDTVEGFLAKRMDELRVDDAMLLEEGIESLSLSELEFACEERGIVDGYGNIEQLRSKLNDWLAIYNTDVGATPESLPASLLVHAPALMNPEARQH